MQTKTVNFLLIIAKKNNDEFEDSITVSNSEKNEPEVIINTKSVDLLDLGNDDDQNNNINISSIVRTNTVSVDNSSLNIMDILQGVSLIDINVNEVKNSVANIPRQVLYN